MSTLSSTLAGSSTRRVHFETAAKSAKWSNSWNALRSRSDAGTSCTRTSIGIDAFRASAMGGTRSVAAGPFWAATTAIRWAIRAMPSAMTPAAFSVRYRIWRIPMRSAASMRAVGLLCPKIDVTPCRARARASTSATVSLMDFLLVMCKVIRKQVFIM
jgi:hypothetical protein